MSARHWTVVAQEYQRAQVAGTLTLELCQDMVDALVERCNVADAEVERLTLLCEDPPGIN